VQRRGSDSQLNRSTRPVDSTTSAENSGDRVQEPTTEGVECCVPRRGTKPQRRTVKIELSGDRESEQRVGEGFWGDRGVQVVRCGERLDSPSAGSRLVGGFGVGVGEQ